MVWEKNKIAYNNIKDTLSKEKLDKIKKLRFEKEMSMPKIGKEMNMSSSTIFKIIKKHFGLGTHRKWLE